MDAVYILGSGSLANDEEILYSCRSLAQHMLDLRSVYVIGEDPKHLPGAIHIPAQDTAPYKWQNAYRKVCEACNVEGISDEFLLMNDDFFLTSDFMGEEFPFYAVSGSNGGPCGSFSFQTHTPMRIKKDWFLAMPFDPQGKACKSPRSLYANFYSAPPTFINDVIVRAGKGARDYDEQIKDLPCFSIGDPAMLYEDFAEWLCARYSTPCEFEV